MSHFAVLVIGNDVEKQLAPYHEFECTDIDDEFVVDVDKTDEARKAYEADDDKTQTFAQFVEGWYGIKPLKHGQKRGKAHKYGYCQLDAAGDVVKVIDHTNPHSKWDWYQVGGRWTGFFKVKPGKAGLLGDPGVMTHPAKSGTADSLRKSDIDIDGMRAEDAQEAGALYDKVHAVIAGRDWKTWPELRDAVSDAQIEEARKAYWAQSVVQDLRNSKDRDLSWIDNLERFRVSRADFVKQAADKALSTFAVVKDGQWYEKGSMGWWGIVSDEKDQAEWNTQFMKLFDSLPDDTVLTVVDCHI